MGETFGLGDENILQHSLGQCGKTLVLLTVETGKYGVSVLWPGEWWDWKPVAAATNEQEMVAICATNQQSSLFSASWVLCIKSLSY